MAERIQISGISSIFLELHSGAPSISVRGFAPFASGGGFFQTVSFPDVGTTAYSPIITPCALAPGDSIPACWVDLSSITSTGFTIYTQAPFDGMVSWIVVK
jgi:hypothetical protein